jgi:hypothetical protein
MTRTAPQLPPLIQEPVPSKMIGATMLSSINILNESTKRWLLMLYQSTPSNRLVTAIVPLSVDKQDRPLGESQGA